MTKIEADSSLLSDIPSWSALIYSLGHVRPPGHSGELEALVCKDQRLSLAGHIRRHNLPMSAFGGKADIPDVLPDVRF